MDMRAAAAASNIIAVLLPRFSHGAVNPQITSCGLLSLPRRTLQRVSMAERKQSLPPNVVRASSSPDYESASGGGRSIVDANMPSLRKRIKKLKLQEERKNQRGELESESMEWEKELYPTYRSKICETMGLLHNYLIYTRPSVALASLSAMALVVTASVMLVFVTSVNNTRFGVDF